jgi:hypothetical protein
MSGGLAVCETWVRSRTRGIKVWRALLRPHDYRLRSGAPESLGDRVAELELPTDRQAVMAPLLQAMQSVNAQ